MPPPDVAVDQLPRHPVLVGLEAHHLEGGSGSAPGRRGKPWVARARSHALRSTRDRPPGTAAGSPLSRAAATAACTSACRCQHPAPVVRRSAGSAPTRPPATDARPPTRATGRRARRPPRPARRRDSPGRSDCASSAQRAATCSPSSREGVPDHRSTASPAGAGRRLSGHAGAPRPARPWRPAARRTPGGCRP